MLNLDQVRLLENRVEKAVGKIQTLTGENNHLRTQLSSLQTRVNELEGLVRSFKDDQGRIEEGILNALNRLSAFEDTMFHTETAPTPVNDLETKSDAPTQENLVGLEEDTLQMPEAPEIEAEWQADLDTSAEEEKSDEPAQSQSSSQNGQMDIF